MPKFKDVRAPARQPTPYAALNAVLEHFVDHARALLGDNFIGAYLQGSFALGDFDENSDCDFLVVTHRDITDAELPAFQAMHEAIHDLPPPWRHRLEGSYVPAANLRRWSEAPRDPPGVPPRPADWGDPGTNGSPPRVYPLWFLDHGSRNLVRSEHDNTRVVRWIARAKGVVLAGPDPRTLIDEVAPQSLRMEVRETMRTCAERHVGLEKVDLMAWQAFWVVLYCRMLHALKTGEVTTKKVATGWAMQTLDPRWRPLIDRAWKVRFAPYDIAMGPSDPAEVAETLAFVRSALEIEAQSAPSTQVLAARAAIERKQLLRPNAPIGQGRAGWTGRDPRGPSSRSWTPPPVRPGGRGRRG